ncbi:hypothetical protein [Pannonibacter phragmitetus]|uniref:hypothetical protein n=1 Tax=Pannonibacter phragmitetus TaxID=121719 RepID=UPI0013C48D61|nr:hypothetical protein [Pannonibacter phragmitetus]
MLLKPSQAFLKALPSFAPQDQRSGKIQDRSIAKECMAENLGFMLHRINPENQPAFPLGSSALNDGNMSYSAGLSASNPACISVAHFLVRFSMISRRFVFQRHVAG